MGAELSFSTKIPVRQPLVTDGPGAGDRVSGQLIQQAEFTRQTAQTGAVTLIQQFGSALNLNVHFHMLFLDGVYTTTTWGKSRFHPTSAPKQQKLTSLAYTIRYRVAVGPQHGRKVFRLQTIPSWEKDERSFSSILYKQPPCCDRCSWPRIDSCRRSSSNASNL